MNALQKYVQKIPPEIWKYFSKHFQADIGGSIAVVIPAFDEYPLLFCTLDSISDSVIDCTGAENNAVKAVCIIVVNNRKTDSDAVKTNNKRLLCEIEKLQQNGAYKNVFSLCVIDAASSRNEIPENQGVGFARKIGMDYALLQGAAVIACMDADTIVAKSYIKILHEFASSGSNAAVLQFSHQKTENADSIASYEAYLRSHSARLKKIGTPYFHVALSPCIICKPEIYAMAGGMNKRLAGEDFYFLQSLTKAAFSASGTPDALPLLFDFHDTHDTSENRALVFPSARFSRRVPFGTGRALESGDFLYADEHEKAAQKAFDALEFFIATIREVCNNSIDCKIGSKIESEELAQRIKVRSSKLYEFLLQENFFTVWEKLRKNSPDSQHLETAFHSWFDGLKIVRALHYLAEKH